jgi:uncharacterized protein DUF4333
MRHKVPAIALRRKSVVLGPRLAAQATRPSPAGTPHRGHEPPRRPPIVAVAVAVAALLAGCGTTNLIDPHGAEQSVVNVVTRQTGFRPTDVNCPSGVRAKVGVTFDCQFTGPEPKPYVAHVRIETVRGKRVEFFVATEPLGSS